IFTVDYKPGASIAYRSVTPKTELAHRLGLSHAVPIRVLVVEDFAPFRQFILSTLASRRDLQVIGEVSDGLEAVQKAVELQPDLVLHRFQSVRDFADDL